MSKIIRHEFMGNAVVFYLLCLSIVGIPLAVLYLVNGTVTVEEDIQNPNKFLNEYRSGNYRS